MLIFCDYKIHKNIVWPSSTEQMCSSPIQCIKKINCSDVKFLHQTTHTSPFRFLSLSFLGVTRTYQCQSFSSIIPPLWIAQMQPRPTVDPVQTVQQWRTKITWLKKLVSQRVFAGSSRDTSPSAYCSGVFSSHLHTSPWQSLIVSISL